MTHRSKDSIEQVHKQCFQHSELLQEKEITIAKTYIAFTICLAIF